MTEEEREKLWDDRYNKLEYRAWKGEMAVDYMTDQYFQQDSDVYDHMRDYPDEKLRLVICEPVYARTISDDYWDDDLPEDLYIADLAPELLDKLTELNNYILREKPILSWRAGSFRTTAKLPD